MHTHGFVGSQHPAYRSRGRFFIFETNGQPLPRPQLHGQGLSVASRLELSTHACAIMKNIAPAGLDRRESRPMLIGGVRTEVWRYALAVFKFNSGTVWC